MTADNNPDDQRRVESGDAFDHRDEIRAAYWSGRSLDELAEQWRASLKTIMMLAYHDGSGSRCQSRSWEPTPG